MNIFASWRTAKTLRKGLQLVTIQTAIEEGYQSVLSEPLTLDEVCTTAGYDPGARPKIKLFLDSLSHYGVVEQKTNSHGTPRYKWAKRSDHANEARKVREQLDEILAHKSCGELIRGQHFELAKNWRHIVRGESENELTRAREMIAISIGLRAKLMQEGRKRAIKFAKIEQGTKILDLGCGSGTSTIQLAEAAGPRGYVLGVEVDENLYSEAVVRYQELPSTYRKSIAEVEFAMKDAREGSLEKLGKGFDMATTFLFWHYIKEDEYNKVIANVSGLLTQYGRIGGIEPMHIHDGDVVHGEWAGTAIPEFTRYPGLVRFRDAFKECGFEKFRLSKILMAFCAMRK